MCEGVAPDFSDLVGESLASVDSKIINCYFARVQCSSEFTNQIQQLTPQTILCRDDPNLAYYARVFVPVCSLDWFLGRGDVKNATSTRFRGAFVLDMLLETLIKEYALQLSPLIMLGGTGGGGVAAMHSMKYIRQKLNGPKVIALVDSSWYVDIEGFAIASQDPEYIFRVDGNLSRNTQDWITLGRMNDDCDSFWNSGGPGIASRHRCLIVPELIPFLDAEKIMFIHSQYDLVFLSKMGLLDRDAQNRFYDAQSFALRAISYVESFGALVRSTVQDSASAGSSANHYFFTPSCGSHGFIIPTSVHIIPVTTQPIGDAGSLKFRRDITTWENIKVGGLSVKSAVTGWLLAEGNAAIMPPFPYTQVNNDALYLGVVTDLCTGFLCNPTCTEAIYPFRVRAIFSPCGQNIILTYAILMMGVLWLAFLWGYMRVHIFRYRARQYWTAFKTGKPLPDFGFYQKRLAAAVAEEYIAADDTPLNMTQDPTMPYTPQQAAAARYAPPPPPPGVLARPAPSSSYSTPAFTPAVFVPPPRQAVAAQEEPEEDEIDLVALAEALASKDKPTRLAAKKAYKDHQKRGEKRRKDAKKTNEQREYEKQVELARQEFEERQATLGLASQQAAEEERSAAAAAASASPTKKGKKDKKTEDSALPIMPKFTPILPKPAAAASSAGGNAGKIQQKAQDELLIEAASSDYRKVHLMVRDVSYWAPARVKGNIISRLFRRDKNAGKFQILRNVDLAIKPANVHALMGPSGSGKSTMLDVLALIRDSGDMQGAHYINGVRSHAPEATFLRDWLRHNVSYVRQTDVLFPRMTVREHLQHAAWLLLPQFMPDAKKLRRVQQVIELLELDACVDTICGDGGIKVEGGISGGQRRRVSVATQLLRLPACLLLDEPTSGLDSTNALLLCQSLHTLAHRGGLTIVMTIHQPRNEIFALFDQLTILVAGKIVFSGTPKESVPHFDLDRSDNKELSVGNAILDKLAEASENEVNGYQARYVTGPLGKRVMDDMKAEITDFDMDTAVALQNVLRETAMGEGRWSWESPSSAAMQMWVLMSRTMRRGGFDLRKSVMLAFIGGCVVGLCFLGVGTVTSRTALCYLGVATMTFLQGAFLGDRYLAEKQMFDHESAAGSAVAWQAFLASQFARDSVTSASEAIAFGIPVYWVGGMFPALNRFVMYLILIVLIAHVCISSNVLVEIDRDNLRAAALVNVAYVGLGALFNGFIIQLKDLPVYLSWLPYIMVTYWGFAGILVNDFTGDTFGCKTSVLECATRTGDVVIVIFRFQTVDPYVSILAMTVMTLLFRSLAVFDFFMRYVRGRGSGLNLLQGGKSLEEDTGTVPKFFAAVAAVPSAQSNKRGTAMTSMMNYRGNAGKRMIDMQKRKNEANTKRVQDAGAGQGLVFNEEWDQVQEDNANTYSISAEQPWYREMFLSRPLLIILVIVDIGFLALICALSPKAQTLVSIFQAENAVVALLFFFQFGISLVYLVPITPNGPKDCTWAGANDAIAFFATVADLVLVIQLISNTAFVVGAYAEGAPYQNAATTFLVLASVQRGFRLLRVYNFWYKVARYHEIRAESWLYMADQLKEMKVAQIATALAEGKKVDASIVPVVPVAGDARNANNRISLKSVRLASAMPMFQSHIAAGGDVGQSAKPSINPNEF